MSTTLPEHVGVYGGGRMGSGIAHAFLTAGIKVSIVESTAATAEIARQRVERSVRQAEARDQLTASAEDVLARLSCSSDPSVLEDAGLVVEAVPEDASLKTAVLREMARSAPNAVLATNTSSLSVDELAHQLVHKDRFLGLHFFNPVPVSSLVEIVVGSQTSDALRRQVEAWVAALGKQAIVVADSPGFASSRLGVAIALEAMRMLESGVASADDIDLAMTLGYKHPMGPLRTTDVVGLDVRLAIAEQLARELGERFSPPQILRDKVARGELGRKVGNGFFEWT